MIAIIDLDLGNLHSVARAVNHCDGRSIITDDLTHIEKASKLILPGVGSFKAGMSSIIKKGLFDLIHSRVSEGVPLMGICLGMQLLMDSSEENGDCTGLGLINGNVKRFENLEGFDNARKIPHINWCSVEKNYDISSASALLKGIEDKSEFYFVHSLCVVPRDRENMHAESIYGDVRFCSVLGKENVMGCQFHPEKSGLAGLNFIKNFVRF